MPYILYQTAPTNYWPPDYFPDSPVVSGGGSSLTSFQPVYFDPAAPAVYSVWLKNPAGQVLKVLSDFSHLEYTRTVNQIGAIKLVSEDQSLIDIEADTILEVWRKIPGYRNYVDGETVWRIRKPVYSETPDGIQVEMVGADAIEILNRPRIAYRTETAYTSKSGVASSIMREFVYENAGPGATNPARWRAGGYDPNSFLIERDRASGATVTPKNVIGQKLLAVLQSVTSQSKELGVPIYIDVVRVDDNILEYRSYTGQRGQDRGPGSNQEIVLGMALGTILSAKVSLDYTNSFNVSFVGGGGQDVSRLIGVAVDQSEIGLSPFGLIEGYTDNRNVTVQSTLDNLAMEALLKGGARVIVEATLADSGLRYGVHYGFGDRVTCETVMGVFPARINAIQVVVREGQEEITAGLEIEDGQI